MWILGLKGLKEVNNIQLKLALRTPAQYTDTSLLRTVFFVLGLSPDIFSKFNPPDADPL